MPQPWRVFHWTTAVAKWTERLGSGRLSTSLDAAYPGADGSIPAAVRMENRERIGSTRLAVDGDQDAAARREGLENAAVVRLKTHTPHRARQPEPRKIPRYALQRADQGTARQHRARTGHLEPLSGGAECPFDERSGIGTLPGDDRQGLGRKPQLLQGFEPLLRPGNILENADGESGSVDVNQGRVSIMGV
jgi:hypothetical protein